MFEQTSLRFETRRGATNKSIIYQPQNLQRLQTHLICLSRKNRWIQIEALETQIDIMSPSVTSLVLISEPTPEIDIRDIKESRLTTIRC